MNRMEVTTMTYLKGTLVKYLLTTYRVFATAGVKLPFLKQQAFFTHVTTVALVPVESGRRSCRCVVPLLPSRLVLLFFGSHMVVPYE